MEHGAGVPELEPCELDDASWLHGVSGSLPAALAPGIFVAHSKGTLSGLNQGFANRVMIEAANHPFLKMNSHDNGLVQKLLYSICSSDDATIATEGTASTGMSVSNAGCTGLDLLCLRKPELEAACDASALAHVYTLSHVLSASLWSAGVLQRLCDKHLKRCTKEEHLHAQTVREGGGRMLRKLLRVVARERGPWGHGIQREPNRDNKSRSGVSGVASKSWQIDPRSDPTMRRWRSCLLDRGDPDYNQAKKYSSIAGDYSGSQGNSTADAAGDLDGVGLGSVAHRVKGTGAFQLLQQIESNVRGARAQLGRRASDGSRPASKSTTDEAEARIGGVDVDEEDDGGLGLAKEMLEAQHYGLTKRDVAEDEHSGHAKAKARPKTISIDV